MDIAPEGLAARLTALTGQAVTPAQAAQMQQHWSLICRWSPRLNLVASLEPLDALERHFGDALRVLPHLAGLAGPWADMGSGAGFPGIPLAVMRPTTPIYLVEPRHRRAAFLQVVVARLGLREVRVLTQKAEQGPPEPLEAVVTRATFSSATEIDALSLWLRPSGRVVALRGEEPLLPTGQAGQGGLFLPPQRHFYALGDRRCSCDVWIRTPG